MREVRKAWSKNGHTSTHTVTYTHTQPVHKVNKNNATEQKISINKKNKQNTHYEHNRLNISTFYPILTANPT